MPEPPKYSKIRLRPSIAAEPAKAATPKSPAKRNVVKQASSIGPMGATPTVTVETGSGSDPDANSYISVADASAYLDGSLYATEWAAATADQKAHAVISATRVIDSNCRFRGYRKLTAQPLSWPRVLAKNDEYHEGQYNPLITSMPYYDENSIPKQLKDATCELALELLRSDRTVDAGSKGISDLSLGSGALSLSFNATDRPAPLPDQTRRILDPLVNSFRGYQSGVKRVVRTI